MHSLVTDFFMKFQNTKLGWENEGIGNVKMKESDIPLLFDLLFNCISEPSTAKCSRCSINVYWMNVETLFSLKKWSVWNNIQKVLHFSLQRFIIKCMTAT